MSQVNNMKHHYYTIDSVTSYGCWGRTYATTLTEVKESKRYLKGEGHTGIKVVKVMPGESEPARGQEWVR